MSDTEHPCCRQRREYAARIEQLEAMLMRAHQWINPFSDPLPITNTALMTEIEAALARKEE